MAKIIGRKHEIEELLRLYNRPENQLVTVRGRRRVGKTFLIRETFKDKFAFYHTGVSPLELKGKSLLKEQLKAFGISLKDYGDRHRRRPLTGAKLFCG